MTGWDRQHPDLIVTRPTERVDPIEAALVARLAAAGWTVVDKRAGDAVAVLISTEIVTNDDGCPVERVVDRTFRGPTTVAALTEACEAVGA